MRILTIFLMLDDSLEVKKGVIPQEWLGNYMGNAYRFCITRLWAVPTEMIATDDASEQQHLLRWWLIVSS